MNECEQANRLHAFYDGELDAAARTAFELHLTRCAACTAELASLRRLTGAIRGMPRPEMSPQALWRLHKKIDLVPARAMSRMAEALTAVAALVLLACGAWLLRTSSSGELMTPVPTLETAAMERPVEPPPNTVEGQLAAWTVEDLSKEDRDDQK